MERVPLVSVGALSQPAVTAAAAGAADAVPPSTPVSIAAPSIRARAAATTPPVNPRLDIAQLPSFGVGGGDGVRSASTAPRAPRPTGGSAGGVGPGRVLRRRSPGLVNPGRAASRR